MSRVCIFVDQVAAPLDFLMAVKRINGVAPTVMQRALANSLPMWDVDLFENDHDQLAEDLRKLLDLAATSKIPLRLYELPDEDDLDPSEMEIFRIDEETLLNILDWND